MEEAQLEEVDFTPGTGLLLAELQREKFAWLESFCELIDNSLDAGATRVVIAANKKARCVMVSDNGDGCPQPRNMLQIGESNKKAKDGLGRYGVGLKHASYYLAGLSGRTEIVTSHRAVHSQVSVRWGDLVDAKRWSHPALRKVDSSYASPLLPEGKGTYISFTLGDGRGFPSKDQWDGLLRKLSFIFSPALREGRQIELHGAGPKSCTLSAPRDPSWSESLTFDVVIGGKTAKVRAGIKAPDDKSGQVGLSYTYRHRVIIQDSALGCGDFSTAGIAGFVELDHKWTLGQNKSEVTDSSLPQLADAIEQRLRPLLEKAHNATRVIQSEALCSAASEALTAIADTCGIGKPKRPGSGGGGGGGAGTRKRGPVKSATVVSGNGDAQGKGGRGIQIEPRLSPDDPRSGWVDPGAKRVYLNTAIPRVAEAVMSSGDLVLQLAGSHYIAWHVSRPRDQDLPLKGKGEREQEKPTFDALMGKFLAAAASIRVARAV